MPAEAVRDQAIALLEVVRQAAASTQNELEVAHGQLAEVRDALAAEREAHSATEGRLQEIRRQLNDAGAQITQIKTEFTAELERTREQATAAQERASSHEKRALREIDQERTARQKSEKQAEELRAQLQVARIELKDAAVQDAEALASLRTECRLLQQQAESAAKQHLATTEELTRTRSLLQDAQHQAERADTEVLITRRLIDEMNKPPTVRAAKKQKID